MSRRLFFWIAFVLFWGYFLSLFALAAFTNKVISWAQWHVLFAALWCLFALLVTAGALLKVRKQNPKDCGSECKNAQGYANSKIVASPCLFGLDKLNDANNVHGGGYHGQPKENRCEWIRLALSTSLHLLHFIRRRKE